jgi:hypothetical protein
MAPEAGQLRATNAPEFLSHHVEASCLLREDAAFVYDLTSHYISKLATRLAGWQANRVGMRAGLAREAFDPS